VDSISRARGLRGESGPLATRQLGAHGAYHHRRGLLEQFHATVKRNPCHNSTNLS